MWRMSAMRFGMATAVGLLSWSAAARSNLASDAANRETEEKMETKTTSHHKQEENMHAHAVLLARCKHLNCERWTQKKFGKKGCKTVWAKLERGRVLLLQSALLLESIIVLIATFHPAS